MHGNLAQVLKINGQHLGVSADGVFKQHFH